MELVHSKLVPLTSPHCKVLSTFRLEVDPKVYWECRPMVVSEECGPVFECYEDLQPVVEYVEDVTHGSSSS